MSGNPRFSIVFVLGIAHSGSTLLGRMLDMHPDALCVGELLRLEEALANANDKCSCGELLTTCPFWTRWRSRMPEKTQRDYTKLTVPLLDELRVAENRKVLIDLSKTRGYRLAKRWRDARVGYIHIVRDPRGVFRSHLARGGELEARLKVHKKWIKRLTNFAGDNDRSLTVHYEDLVTSPEAVARRICKFLGLTFVRELLTPSAKVHHFVSSNRSAFLKTHDRFQLDERWRHELAAEQVARISDYLKSVPLYRDRYGLPGGSSPLPTPAFEH